jgi:hypothetical protein
MCGEDEEWKMPGKEARNGAIRERGDGEGKGHPGLFIDQSDVHPDHMTIPTLGHFVTNQRCPMMKDVCWPILQ